MNQGEIEAILERHIRAGVYWTYRHKADPNPTPRAEWYGSPDAAREILKAQESDLAAAQERLAEMRQQMTYVRNCIEDEPMDAQFKSDLLWDIDQALCAAPAGGRVLWRREGWVEHGSREWFGPPGTRIGLTRIYIQRPDPGHEDKFRSLGPIEIYGIHGDEGQQVIITIREATPEATEGGE